MYIYIYIGGGGAPLRDKGGEPIANLRAVIKENSPSPNKGGRRDKGNRRSENDDDSDHDKYDKRRERDSRDRSYDDRDQDRYKYVCVIISFI
jgi:hypothetical protein